MSTLLLLFSCAGAELRLPYNLATTTPIPVEQTNANIGRIGAAAYRDLGRSIPQSEENIGYAGPDWQHSAFSFLWSGARSLRVTCIARVRASDLGTEVTGPLVAVEESMLDCSAAGDEWTLAVDARNEDVVGTLVTRKGAPVPVVGGFEYESGYRSSQVVGYTLGPGGAVSLLNRPHVWYADGSGPEDRDAIGAAAVALIRWRDTEASMIGVLAAQ